MATLLAAATAAAQPVGLYPANPHYFRVAGKPAVLVTSGEHYGAVLNREFDYVRYLDTLRADRMNLTRTFSGSYREEPGDFKIASNTLAPAPGKFIAPWAQRDGKFDLTKWDAAYFARLKDFVAQAGRRGVVVELVLFCPFYRDSMWKASPMNTLNNINGIGNVARSDVLALKDPRLTEVQDAMVRKIVGELRDFDNLYYEICNEPYFGGVTAEWQEHIAQVIVQTEAAFPKKHLIAQNWANGSKVITKPNPLVSLFNFHYSRPPSSVAMNWGLDRAIGNNETGFDGAADATYRIQGWDFLMAGGALYNNLDYSFTVGHEDGTFAPPPDTPGGGSAAL
ncbi:MAG TPA: cellulase family glycosylhydrolase, partial [Bryobacteraceae bacterium]|nr:cellulase family glycosylhydrolase [Bryobacteraceae bacterium]